MRHLCLARQQGGTWARTDAGRARRLPTHAHTFTFLLRPRSWPSTAASMGASSRTPRVRAPLTQAPNTMRSLTMHRSSSCQACGARPSRLRARSKRVCNDTALTQHPSMRRLSRRSRRHQPQLRRLSLRPPRSRRARRCSTFFTAGGAPSRKRRAVKRRLCRIPSAKARPKETRTR